jgi:hypothetical protein
MFNGAYTILDKDGYYFAVYGTGLYKFGYKDPTDPLSGLQLVKSLDLKAALPADLAATVSRVIGINLTADGRIAFAMSGLVGVVDRELSGLQFIPIAGEAIDNNLAADAQAGLYVVTDKFMRKLVWTGEQLSADEADGAWQSAYDIADIQIPGIVSRGSGTTPTLSGTPGSGVLEGSSSGSAPRPGGAILRQDPGRHGGRSTLPRPLASPLDMDTPARLARRHLSPC